MLRRHSPTTAENNLLADEEGSSERRECTQKQEVSTSLANNEAELENGQKDQKRSKALRIKAENSSKLNLRWLSFAQPKNLL